MSRILAFLYGIVVYAFFFVTFLYAIGFVTGLVVPKAIDSGAVAPLVPSLIVDVILMSIFAVQHSVMARPGFKRWWTTIVPTAIERSTYVLLASLALALLFWQWRPMPAAIWRVTDPTWAAALTALSLIGFGIVLVSTFLINHFDLFGLRQVMANLRQREIPPHEFATPLFYKLVRHPIYLGFVIAFWAAPVMSLGRLLFAVVTTAYILVAIVLEERDLVGVFGQTYLDYRARVPMLVPFVPKAKPRIERAA